ncbi:unnamed protein product, partial [Didymodactylos carnosus]
HGAYFADNPTKSHMYAPSHPTSQNRVMFYNKVILGNEHVMHTTNKALVSAPKNYHSIRGSASGFTEYIVYRYGQALPYLKIVYKT